jgi:hypothetical protein
MKIIKPSVQELTFAYQARLDLRNASIDDIKSSMTYHNNAVEAEEIFKRNYNYLVTCKLEDYNQLNFQTLISSIERNGMNHFNMQAFLGIVYPDRENYGPTPTHEKEIDSVTTGSAPFLDVYTSSFNCNSIGCIAGFAMAEAFDWVQPKFITGDTRSYSYFFEQVACNWLNIPVKLGQMIFYGDSPNVWAFAKAIDGGSYKSIELENECYYDDDDDIIESQDWEEYGIELSSIDFKTATDVLRRIASGEFIYNFNDQQYGDNNRGTFSKTTLVKGY